MSTACDDESPEECDPAGQEPTTRKKGDKTDSTGGGAPRFLRLAAFKQKPHRLRLRFPEFHQHELPEHRFRAAKTHLKAIRRTAQRLRTFIATERAAARHMLDRDDVRRDQHQQKKDAAQERRRQYRRDKETHRARHWRPEHPTP